VKDPHFNASFARLLNIFGSARQHLGKKTLNVLSASSARFSEILRPTLEANKRTSGRHCRPSYTGRAPPLLIHSWSQATPHFKSQLTSGTCISPGLFQSHTLRLDGAFKAGHYFDPLTLYSLSPSRGDIPPTEPASTSLTSRTIVAIVKTYFTFILHDIVNVYTRNNSFPT
jgi:hypothetical protein